MPHAAAEEPVQALLAAAALAGCELSRAQLRRYQQEGLLQRPRQRGLGRGRGTEVLYPPGSTRQLIALLDFLRQRRSFRTVRWCLWWEGFVVPDDQIRVQLLERLDELDDIRRVVLALKEADEFDLRGERAWQLLGQWARGRLTDPTLRNLRKRVGKDRFATLVVLAYEITTGALDPWRDRSDAETLANGAGLASFAKLRTTEQQTAFLDRLNDFMQAISRVASPAALRLAFDAASFEELQSARDELRRLFELLDPLVALAQVLAGNRAVNEELATLPDTPTAQALALLVWLAVRELPGAIELYGQFVALGQELGGDQPGSAVLDYLKEETSDNEGTGATLTS